MEILATPTNKQIGNLNEEDYHAVLQQLQANFLAKVTAANFVLFTANLRPLIRSLWEHYLAACPEDRRQICNCNACRTFIERYGDLVIIQPDGIIQSAVWDGANTQDTEYAEVFNELQDLVERAQVDGMFFSSDSVWGQPKTGVWQHMALVPPKECVHDARVYSADQKMAFKREDCR